MRTGVGFAPMVIRNVHYSIHVFYETYNKASAYCCENNITERKADNADIISICVFIKQN